MKAKNSLPVREAWIIWFVLGIVMLNYPFLHIFNKDVLVFGVPLTIVYFFVGWPISIFVIYLFSIYLARQPSDSTETNGQEDDLSDEANE